MKRQPDGTAGAARASRATAPRAPTQGAPTHGTSRRAGGSAGDAGADRDRVLAATDIAALIGEHVALRRKGRELVGLCPFHDDHSPSMAVVTHKGDGFYKCFSCGAAGNAIDFAMEHLRMDFRGALEFLAQRAGLTLAPRGRSPDGSGSGDASRSRLLEANAEAARHWRALLLAARAGRSSNAAALAAAQVIAERGIADAMVEEFQLGVALDSWGDLLEHAQSRGIEPGALVAAGLAKARDGQREGQRDDQRAGGGHFDMFRNRLIFPICDESGRPVAFGARRLDPQDNPKYLNSPESPLFRKARVLYGLHLAKRAIIDADMALVTEGYTDVIACHQHGIRNAVATLGTALTPEHARTLRRLCSRVVLLFDGDAAGQRAADRAAEIFFSEPVDVLVCVLPDDLDPDELLRLEDGPARFRAALDAAVPVIDFVVERFGAGLRDGAAGSARQQRVEAFLARLAELGLASSGPLRRESVLRQLAPATGFSVAALGKVLDGLGARGVARPRAMPERELAERDSPAEMEAGGAERLPDGPPSPPAPKAIMIAEAALLGVLVRHPDLGAQGFDVGDGHRLPVVEAFAAESFRHEPHRLLAAALFSVIEGALFEMPGRAAPGGGVPDATPLAQVMPRLMAAVARSDLRLLASDLFFAAERRTAGRGQDAAELLRQACIDLDAVRRRHDCREPLDSSAHGPIDTAQAERLIRMCHERGHDPAAIASLTRRSH